MKLDYTLTDNSNGRPTIGMVVLQTDETLESEFRHYFTADDWDIYVSRVPNDDEVTPDTLGAMEHHLTAAATLLPRHLSYDAVAYGCTSGTSVIGEGKVRDCIREGCNTTTVTNPISALLWKCKDRDIRQLAFVSPYIDEVNTPLRNLLAENGVATDHFGSFEESNDNRVAQISADSIVNAGIRVCEGQNVDGLFLSCTNLKTLEAIPRLEKALGIPVFSSNSVMADHVKTLARGQQS